MPDLQQLLRHEMPPHLASQIRSYVRTQWPFLNPGNTQLWNYTPQPIPSRHFVLTEGELLISHATVNERDLTHHGSVWCVGGLSTVFTYPDYRGSGFASQVVAAATQHLLQSNADLALLFAGHHLKKFYVQHGWIPAPTAQILFGDANSPQPKTDNLIMTLFISPAALAKQSWFTNEKFYVGETTW